MSKRQFRASTISVVDGNFLMIEDKKNFEGTKSGEYDVYFCYYHSVLHVLANFPAESLWFLLELVHRILFIGLCPFVLWSPEYTDEFIFRWQLELRFKALLESNHSNLFLIDWEQMGYLQWAFSYTMCCSCFSSFLLWCYPPVWLHWLHRIWAK